MGAFGTQGLAVVDKRSGPRPTADGAPSQYYLIRALTGDPHGPHAKKLAHMCRAREGYAIEQLRQCLGCLDNTTGLSVGETKEVYVGMRICELTK
ncbi:hypothetical protein C8Q80DRAFT_1328118 [Daedaleopsis nitida]|nr:hypothetical protein C8Q80DRAFT_1328118 [Daedaleopsis nitida]